MANYLRKQNPATKGFQSAIHSAAFLVSLASLTLVTDMRQQNPDAASALRKRSDFPWSALRVSHALVASLNCLRRRRKGYKSSARRLRQLPYDHRSRGFFKQSYSPRNHAEPQ